MQTPDTIFTPSGKIFLRENDGRKIILEDRVYRYLTPAFRQYLDEYLDGFKKFRKEDPHIVQDENLYDGLPYNIPGAFWKFRAMDIDFILQHISPNSEVLEIGSWNGWLAHALSRKGHSVTAIDYFLDFYDGLKAINHYSHPHWTALNMETEDIVQAGCRFDMIIFNRGISYVPDMKKMLDIAKELLNEKGKIILTGINIYTDPSLVISRFEKTAKEFETAYGMPIEIKPGGKRALSEEDLQMLKEYEFSMVSQQRFPGEWARKYFYPRKHRTYSGIWQKG